MNETTRPRDHDTVSELVAAIRAELGRLGLSVYRLAPAYGVSLRRAQRLCQPTREGMEDERRKLLAWLQEQKG